MSDVVEIELQPLGKTIEVERGTPLQEVLHAHGVEFPCGGLGHCGGCRVRVIGGSLPISEDQKTVLSPREWSEGWRLACRCRAEARITLQVAQWDTVILADHSSLRFTPRSGRGVVVDLGTTTLVAQLLDLSSGQVLAVQTALNPQARYGADVMSRVEFALASEGQAKLVHLIRQKIGDLVLALEAEAGSDHIPPDTVVIVGNTVMHHLFCGLDLEPLSRSPFETAAGGPHEFCATELGWRLSGDPMVRVLPCLGGFVGSDILAGVLATDMHQSPSMIGLVDLGTNGEIAFGNRDGILCASTAAGPAFEGGRISMGMQASTGAISEVTIREDRLHCRVVGGTAPRGICGSGLVDAVAAGLDLGLIHPSGRLTAKQDALVLASPVTLTQQDIRQVQLAKGAIAAGMRILLGRHGSESIDVSRMYLAGAFGNYVKPTSARRIGLIEFPEERVEAAGNTALLGAKLALFMDESDDRGFGAIRKKIHHVSLAADPQFQEIFIAETAFPD
jgi:uncharacterized 2Fe-2S/4Fe-4S cluster protein (DUF4445 family)